MATISAAERCQRIIGHLNDARQQAAALAREAADGQSQLDTLTKMQASAEASVVAAERAADSAAAQVIDKHSELLVLAGTDDEAAAQSAHDGAVDAHQTARQRLDEARATLEQVKSRSASEGDTINARMADLQIQRRDVAHQIASLERQKKQAGEQAAQEAADAAKVRILTKYVALWDEIQQDVGMLGPHAATLPRTLLPVELTTVAGNQPWTVLYGIITRQHGDINNITRYAKAELAGLERSATPAK